MSGEGATILLRVDRDVPAEVQQSIKDEVGAKTVILVDLS